MTTSSRAKVPLGMKIAVLAIVFTVAALGMKWLLIKAVTSLHPPNWYIYGPDIFYRLMGSYEPIALSFFLVAALFFLISQRDAGKSKPVTLNFLPRQILLLACAVFLFCWWGTTAVYHRFPVSLDEHAAFFQAGIFAGGHILGTIPPELNWLRHVIVPDFIVLHKDNTIVEAYLPTFSVLLALGTVIFGSPWVVNPLLSAGSLLFIYGIARNLAYSNAFVGWTVIFLVTSCQFLINGLSGYAMTAHLFFSLAWLYFYTHSNKRLYYLCPLLGVFALGLHQPICHILFVVPFLFRLVLNKRWMEVFYSAGVYLFGGLGWIYWMILMRPENNAAAEKLFAIPDLKSAFIFYLSLLLLISWQNFLAVLFFVAAFFKFRSMPPLVRDLVFSSGLTLVFYLFFIKCQGAGWGYRYMFPVLGNLCLIAAWGASQFAVSRFNFAAAALIALGIQLPFRCVEVRHVVGVQAHAYEVLSNLKADYVIIDHSRGVSAVELVRNNPDFTNRPLLLFRSGLTDEEYSRLQQKGKTVWISREEFRQLNIPALP